MTSPRKQMPKCKYTKKELKAEIVRLEKEAYEAECAKHSINAGLYDQLNSNDLTIEHQKEILAISNRRIDVLNETIEIMSRREVIENRIRNQTNPLPFAICAFLISILTFFIQVFKSH